jgi:hypothetical protein
MMAAASTLPRIRPIERPGLVLRACYAVGRRLFGRVPTPAKLIAHRPALLFGLGGLWTAIEYGGRVDRALRALLQLQVATLYRVPF